MFFETSTNKTHPDWIGGFFSSVGSVFLVINGFFVADPLSNLAFNRLSEQLIEYTQVITKIQTSSSMTYSGRENSICRANNRLSPGRIA
jgi:hypothetical protein